jgi:hypothetical protein
MKQWYKFSMLLMLALVTTLPALAQQIALQGILRDQTGRSVANGNYALTFRLYTGATGGTAVWTETHPAVAVQQGVYSVMLGSVTSIADLGFDVQYFLGVSIQGGAELTPRITLTTVPYARGVIGKTNKFPSTGDVVLGGNAQVNGNMNLGAGGKINFNDGTSLSSGAVSGVASSGFIDLRVNTDGVSTENLHFRYGANGEILYNFTPSLFVLEKSTIVARGFDLALANQTFHHFNITRNNKNRFIWSTSLAQAGDAVSGTGGHSLVLERMNNDGGYIGHSVVFHRDGRAIFNGDRATAFNAAVRIEALNNGGGGNPALELMLGNNTELNFYRHAPNQNAVIDNYDADIVFATWLNGANRTRSVMVGRADDRLNEAPFQVYGSATATNHPNYVFFARGGTNNAISGYTPSNPGFISMYTDGRILAGEFNAYSDSRIKNVAGISNSTADLELLNKIEVVDYTYIDKVAKGDQMVKKVIAQQLETVLPAAVKKGTDVIPNVYDLAEKATFNAAKKQTTITVKKAHTFVVGDEIQLLVASGPAMKKVVAVKNENTFVVETESELKDVFVYGKKVNDFRTVDYEAVSMLNVSATQALYKRLVELENTVAKLKDIETKHASLSAEVSEMKDLMRQMMRAQNNGTTTQPSNR